MSAFGHCRRERRRKFARKPFSHEDHHPDTYDLTQSPQRSRARREILFFE
jgi:hypothetical protein